MKIYTDMNTSLKKQVFCHKWLNVKRKYQHGQQLQLSTYLDTDGLDFIISIYSRHCFYLVSKEHKLKQNCSKNHDKLDCNFSKRIKLDTHTHEIYDTYQSCVCNCTSYCHKQLSTFCLIFHKAILRHLCSHTMKLRQNYDFGASYSFIHFMQKPWNFQHKHYHAELIWV